MNLTMADPAERSYKSPVVFFMLKSHSECTLAYVDGSANKQKQRVSFTSHVSHAVYIFCLS